MSTPAGPQIIAEVGSVVMAEEGPRVLVIDRGTGPLAAIAFVLGIFALVLGRGDTERHPSPYPGHLLSGGIGTLDAVLTVAVQGAAR
jgi:hypothetical protein